MFRHRRELVNTSVVLLVLLATTRGQSNARSYDTNDWIPVPRPCPTCLQNDEPQSDGSQRRPTGRVLNLPSSDQKRFFPSHQADSQSFNLGVEKPPPQQARLTQNPAQFQQQQIVLPPQLHSLISENQPHLSPQRINNQLLHVPNGLNYQQPGQTIPVQQFSLNGTEFNPRDMVQNINLGLYNQQQSIQPQRNVQQSNNNGREEVQLLYVPLENLRGQRQQIDLRQQADQRLSTPQTYNKEYQPVAHKQEQLQNIQQDFVQQALQAQKLQEQFQHNISPIPQQNFRRPYTTETVTHPSTTSPAPKKRKPHQPPLAVYMGTEGHHNEIKLGDVLTLLKDAKTISVQDNVGPDAPQVFVGPSHLAPPNGYVKFDLPYLSSIENNRVERKVDQLPFFVAPLSYKAPAGYSKIPFPAPHVGSVVINHLRATADEHTTTESLHYQLNKNEEESNTQVSYSSAEVSTVRTRGRQRQSSRNNYGTSTIQTSVSSEIPYGPLATKSPSHEQQYSDNSPNPFGPTEFIQTTTPVTFEYSASLPEQIFSTKNRFAAPASIYKLHNIPDRHVQFVQQHQEETVTEYTPLATTLSSIVSNDKYTVLEQFPLPQKNSQNKYTESVTQRTPTRYNLRGHQPDNFYNDESKEKSLLSNIQSNEQFLTETAKSPYSRSKDTTQQYIPQHQEVINTQISAEHYSHQSSHPVQYEISTEPQSSRPQNEHNIQQYTTEQTSAEYEETTGQSGTQSRVRGKQNFTPDPYYRDNYETQNIRNKPANQNNINNQQIHQHQTPVYESQQSSILTQNIRGKDPYYKQDYESQNINTKPVHQLNQQVEQQNAEYNSQEILHQVQPQVTRGRDHNTQEIPIHLINQQVLSGRDTPQLLHEPSGEEYTYNQKPIKQEVPIVTGSFVNYEIPSTSTQKPQEVVEQSQYVNDPYYTPEQEQTRLKYQPPYSLPSQLPPISPQLPGLVNSLQDQALRPLLAPLLIPPSEQTPVTEYTSEYYTTPTTSTTTTTTPVPIVETTTQFKRTRSRQRGTRPSTTYEYVNTTPTSRRTSSYRGRRPYTSRTRQEYPKQVQEESISVSTVLPDIVTDTSTRAALNRNRFVQREHQYVSSTTERPRSSQTNNSRQRFRTRARPIKNDEDYTEGITTEHVTSFKQPPLEGGFQESSPIIHNVELSQPIISTNSQLNPQDQALVYVQNTNKQILQEHGPIQISTEEYVPRKHYASSTELFNPVQQSTISVSAAENNIVSDDLHNAGVVLVNHNQNHVSYLNAENIDVNRHEYNSNKETNENSRFKYEEPEVQVQNTTPETPRIRSRIRGRPRTRGHQSVSTRYQTLSSTTTTTQRSTTDSKDEESQEFYGFFRPPSFVKPVKMEYKQSSELRTVSNPTPTVAYIRKPNEENRNVYISSANSPVYSTPAGHIDDNQAEHNIRTQYVSSTIVPPSESSEEDFIDIKPVTHRPTSSFNRRRPVTTPAAETSTELPQHATQKYYTVRPFKRPETQTPKITRIRGRIRKPNRSTTAAPVVETEGRTSYPSNHQHYSQTNELSSTNLNDYSTPVKTRQRISSRGKSHFQLPRNENLAVLEPESDNYPSNFLRTQQSHLQKPDIFVNIPESVHQNPVNVLSAEEIVTPRPSFQLTIEPEDSEEEYSDQIPYSSVNKHRGVHLEDGGAESKYSAKIVQKPSNFNFIVYNEKHTTNLDKTTEKLITVDNTDFTTVKNEPAVSETDELFTVQEVTTLTPEVDVTQTESISDAPTTTTEGLTDKPRRRGVWKLVKLRPVTDEFESAESQNVGTVFDNSFVSPEKPVRKYHSVQRTRTTTEEMEEEATTVSVPEIVKDQERIIAENHEVPKIDKTTEADIFAPLYEMFGYSRYGDVSNQFDASESDEEISDATTTVVPTDYKVLQEDVEMTTTGFYNTTEVSQDYTTENKYNVKMNPDGLDNLAVKDIDLADKNKNLTDKNTDLAGKEIDLEDKDINLSDKEIDLADKDIDVADKDADLSGKDENSTTEDSWKQRIIGTSTTTEISHETEICYRGRCVKSSTEEKSEWL